MKGGYFTECPLVVIGATGRLSSELVFYALLQRFSRRLVLCGGSEERLQGLRDEIEESGFGDEWGSLEIHTTLSMEEAVSEGGYLLLSLIHIWKTRYLLYYVGRIEVPFVGHRSTEIGQLQRSC